jgi:tetratricopeptide (TPR) repeat protein
LERYASISADALSVGLRLLELDQAAKDWKATFRNSHRVLAVNPLLPQPHRALARAAEALGKGDEAIGAYRKLLAMDPEDPAEVHYRLAQLLQKQEPETAKKHVLWALEVAPRFRAAHRLLLQLVDEQPGETNSRITDSTEGSTDRRKRR